MDQAVPEFEKNETKAQSASVEIQEGSAVLRLNESTRLCHLSTLLPLTSTETDVSTNSTVRKLIDFRVYLEAAAYLALRHFNERNPLPRLLADRLKDCDVHLSIEMRDTRFSSIHAAQELQTIRAKTHSLETPLPFSLLGAARSEVSQTLSILSGVYELPQISATSTSGVLDNKESSPLFARTVPTNSGDARAMIRYLDYRRVTHVGIIYIQDGFGSFFHASLLNEAALYNIKVVSTSYNDNDNDKQSIETAIQQLVEAEMRYIVGIFNPRTWKTVVREASNAGIIGTSGYTWILSEASLELTQSAFSLDVETETDLARAVNGVGVVSLSVPKNEPFEQALSAFETDTALQAEFVANHVESDRFDDYKFLSPGGSLYQYLNYDAVMALGIAACEAPTDFFTGPELYDTLVHTEFQGISGAVSFDSTTGTRNVSELLYGVQNVLISSERSSNTTYLFTADTSVVVDLRSDAPIQILKDFVHVDGTVSVPEDLPAVDVELNLIPRAVRGVGLAFATFAMFCAVVWFVWTLRYRKKDVVRIAQPVFLCQVCVGALIFSSAVIPMSMQEPVSQSGLDTACMATPWLLSLGFVTAFSALFSKTWRLNKLFNHGETFRRVKIEAKDVMYPFVILSVLNITLLLVWSIGWPLEWTRVQVDNFDEFGRSVESYGTCYGEGGLEQSQFILALLLVLVDISALVFANYQNYKARNLPTDFNESFYVSVIMAGMLEALFIGVPILVLVMDNPSADFMIRSVLVTIISLIILLPVFIPKYMQQSIRSARGMSRGHISKNVRSRLQRTRGFPGSVVEEGEPCRTGGRVRLGQSTIRRTEDYYVQRSSVEEGTRGRTSILDWSGRVSNS